ncbi:hypothetical protein V5N11_015565 [Cardamine amara subsp. amara]|uniref:Retrotransposon Copia-like N-terminal domain-containing protein n=1 Tax=Cardamine amara subsp. amara TaxID=228776 RepID=A0ABD0Z611_CARAN
MEETKPTAIRVTLRGENYLLWSRSTKSNLYGRGLWNQVEPAKGKELQEGNEEAREKWLQKDQMVLSIIHSSLSDSIFESYSYCETAQELWETLKKVYGDITNLSRVFEVKKGLSNLTQEDQDFVEPSDEVKHSVKVTRSSDRANTLGHPRLNSDTLENGLCVEGVEKKSQRPKLSLSQWLEVFKAKSSQVARVNFRAKLSSLLSLLASG